MPFIPAPSRDVQKRARILDKRELKHVLEIATLTREPERNQLVLLLSHALGLRVGECGRITIRDMLHPSGAIKDELTLRSEITKFNKTRIVPVSSPALRQALDAYLDYRIREHRGVVVDATEFRGLAPDLPLLLSERGTGFSQRRKRKALVSGEVCEYRALDPLEAVFRRLYERAGLYGASSHSGRRYYASTLLAQGLDVETIAYLLGHVSSDMTTPYLIPSTESIRQAFELAL